MSGKVDKVPCTWSRLGARGGINLRLPFGRCSTIQRKKRFLWSRMGSRVDAMGTVSDNQCLTLANMYRCITGKNGRGHRKMNGASGRWIRDAYPT